MDILKVHAKNVHLDETVNFEEIALATSGAVGSDLANMINEAAILAVKKGRNRVSQKDLFEAVEVVLVGKEKKNKILSQKEREIVSYHEVGHALVSALQKHSEPVQKNHHCSQDHGSTWVRYECAGGREIFKFRG